MAAFLVIDVFQVLHPGEALTCVRGRGVVPTVLQTQPQERREFLPQRRQGAFLEGDEVLPVVLLAQIQNGAVVVEGVEQEAQGELGII